MPVQNARVFYAFNFYFISDKIHIFNLVLPTVNSANFAWYPRLEYLSPALRES